MTGQILDGRYRLDAPLGSGGQAEVWRATDLVAGEGCAVKIYLEGEQLDLAARAEAAALSLLHLPGVVALRACGQVGLRAYAVLDLVQDAEAFPGAACPCRWDALVPLAERLLLVLSRVHARGVLHRDLKPGNVLVDRQGRLVLVDFGLARIGRADRSSSEAILGDVLHLAPEVLEGAPATVQSELYTVGVMLFRALTGQDPWLHDGTALGLERAKRRTPARRVEDLGIDLSPAASGWLCSLLAAAPGLRPVSAAQALHRLQRATGARSVSDPDALLPARDVLDEATLAALFLGPERFHRIPSDAARALQLRTGGRRAAVLVELRTWELDGLITRVGDRYRTERAALDRLAMGEGLTLAPGAGAALPDDLDRRTQDLLVWLALTGAARPELLARVSRSPLEEVEGRLRRLERAGAVEVVDGRVLDRTGGVALTALSDLERTRRHQRVAAALDPCAPGRLRHLLASGDFGGAAIEALALAAELWRDGQLTALAGLMDTALAWGGPMEEAQARALLEWLVAAALASEIPAWLVRARAAAQRAEVAPLVDLCAAAQAARAGRPEEVARALDGLGAFDSELLEIGRVQVAVQAAGLRWPYATPPPCPRRPQAELLAELQRDWAGGRPAREARLHGWMGIQQFYVGAYHRAAELHLEAAEAREDAAGKLASQLGAALALLEAGRWSEAAAAATVAERTAIRIRHPAREATSVRVQRAARYRSGEPVAPDDEIVQAASDLDDDVCAGTTLLQEATHAWRHQLAQQAHEIAVRAHARLESVGRRDGARLALALADAAVPSLDPELRVDLARGAWRCDLPLVGLQVLGLLAARLPDALRDPVAAIALADAQPRDRWDERREVLSVAEALEMITAGPARAN